MSCLDTIEEDDLLRSPLTEEERRVLSLVERLVLVLRDLCALVETLLYGNLN